MRNYDVIIIGGCASGLAAAINMKRLYPDKDIAVIERLPRIGKKITATGNGRCNLSNRCALIHNYKNISFAQYAMNRYDVEKTLAFFASLGLLTYEDSEGRIYPLSNTAASVVDALRYALDGITIITDTKIENATKSKDKFILDNKFTCDKLIIAAGGKASPSQGTDGSGYALAEMLGHSITKLYPALVPLNADTKLTKPLKGIRIHEATLTLISNGQEVSRSAGELLFTESGLSGIAAMELAADVEKNRSLGQQCCISIDFLPQIGKAEIEKYISVICANATLRDFDSLLTGIMPKAAGMAICKSAGLYKEKIAVSEINNVLIKKIASAAKDFRIEVFSSKGFVNAQVTSGGVRVDEINPDTMESLICNNLFFAGEVIDVDGRCGGFNLQWAWSSGLVAGELGGKPDD